MKKFIIPVAIVFIFLFSCEDKDRCECVKHTYSYDGDYPVATEEEVNCPADLEDGDYIIEWRDDQRIDYIIGKTCY